MCLQKHLSVARRKTIYEYHRLSMKDRPIQNKTAILFTSLPTCNTNPDCNSCLLNYDYEYEYYDDQLRAPAHKLECRWCEALGRCSDGTDRNRQEWLKNKCDSYNVSVIQYCSKVREGILLCWQLFVLNFSQLSPISMELAGILVSPNWETFQIIMTTRTTILEVRYLKNKNHFKVACPQKSNKISCRNIIKQINEIISFLGSKMSAGSIVVSVMITMLVITFCGWLGYAYFNPNTASGRFLIKVNISLKV